MRLPKRKDYPKYVQVREEEYEIRFVSKIGKGKDTSTLGLCNPSSRQIFIRNRQHPRERFKTFIHEVLHAVEFEFNLNIKHSLVYALEEAIFSLLADNF